jgi:murein DD-endopeptidase MepM/ murein hydrolase activator NlpD
MANRFLVKSFARVFITLGMNTPSTEAQMLPQKHALRGRKLFLRRFVAWSGLPFLGVVTAFGFLPQVDYNSVKTKTVIEEITLPHSAPVADVTTFWRNEQVRRGDTVYSILRRMDVDDNAAKKYFRNASAAKSWRRLSAGGTVQAETDVKGGLLTLRYMDSDGRQTLIEKNGDKFTARILPAHLEERMFVRTGEIKTTLYAATDKADLPDLAATQLADIFGSVIDFHHDLKAGDRFSVIYEIDYSNGEPVHAGRILAAEFINSGRSYRALYYKPDGEHGDYYTPEGRSIHKPFLRSPVEYTRISSGYSSARFHPILHRWRAHRGIDFAAPLGTRVRATADGTIVFSGTKTGYGNLVVIKHRGSFSTAYGHLSRFAHHLHAGQHVAQGEVIGYVGMTGWATGPHLHYEFRVDGQQRNPQNYPMPETPPISNTQLSAFQAATRDMNARLGMLHETVLARLD